MEKLKKIKAQICNLSLDEVYELEKIISYEIKKKGQELVHQSLEMLDSCAHCASSNIILWGNYSGTKRYRCKSCNKTFSQTCGSVLHHIKKKDSFLLYASGMFSEKFTELKTISKRIGISVNTAMDWRHKILIALGDSAPKFRGEIEMDGVWFRYSQKGRKGLKYSKKRGENSHTGDNAYQAKLLVTKERQGVCDIALIKIGRIAGADIGRRLNGKFDSSAILFSDKHSGIRVFSKSENINHETFKAKEHTRNKVCHVQTVNNIAEVMKTVFNRKFRGVATKYLHVYATWASMKNTYKQHENRLEIILNKCISNRKAWGTFTNIERLYKTFIYNYSKRTYRYPVNRKWKSQLWNFNIAKSGNFI